jgi:hypothetical protein
MASNNSNPSGLRRSTRERRPVKYYGGQYDEQMKDYAPGAPTPTTSAIVAGNGVDEEPSAVVTHPVVNNLPRGVTPETSSELTEAPESPKPASASSGIVVLQPTSTWVSRPGLGKLKTRKPGNETVVPLAASAEIPRTRVVKPKARKAAKAHVRRHPSRKMKTTDEDESQEAESHVDYGVTEEEERSRQEAALALLELSRSTQPFGQVQESTLRDTIYTTVDDDVLSAATILNGMKVRRDDSAIQSKMAKMLQHHQGEPMDTSSGRTPEELDTFLTPPARPKPFPQDLRNPYDVKLSYEQLGGNPPK